jgi:hypothetical protein
MASAMRESGILKYGKEHFEATQRKSGRSEDSGGA